MDKNTGKVRRRIYLIFIFIFDLTLCKAISPVPLIQKPVLKKLKLEERRGISAYCMYYNPIENFARVFLAINFKRLKDVGHKTLWLQLNDFKQYFMQTEQIY